MWLRFKGDAAVSQSGPLLLLLLWLWWWWWWLLFPLGKSAAKLFMNSNDAIKSSWVEDLNRFLGLTAIDVGPEMLIGLC